MASVSTKKKRVVHAIENKLMICKLVEHGKTLGGVATEFNVEKSTVHDIVKRKDKLLTFQDEI